MKVPFTTADLEAYLDESLSADAMRSVEEALRRDNELTRQLAAVHARRDSGVHSLGEIWRRNRISCPPREQLGSFLLGILADDVAAYISFHLETIGCRFCQANLADLQAQQAAPTDPAATARRKKYFQSSAGHLGR